MELLPKAIITFMVAYIWGSPGWPTQLQNQMASSRVGTGVIIEHLLTNTGMKV